MKSIFIFCFALLLASCSGDNDHSNTCGVLFPAKQLPWLKEAIEEYKNASYIDITVEQAEYNSQTIFFITPCCPTCAAGDFMIPRVYTCEGEEINGLTPFDDDIKNRKVIWKTPADEAECW